MGIFDRFKKQGEDSEGKTGVFDPNQLKDFHPYDTGLAQTIQALAAEFHEKAMCALKPCDRDQFIALLGGMPGGPG